MRRTLPRPAVALLFALALPACATNVRTGPLTPAELVVFDDQWRAAAAEAQPVAEAARALASVPPGGEVLIVLGTWCGDSRREVSRFAKALDLAGPVPFEVKWIGVDRAKEAPDFDAKALGVRFVPTFIVSRGGKELGRVVESSPGGIEADVGALLREEKHGELTARPPDPPAP